jgi:hypothetical protein
MIDDDSSTLHSRRRVIRHECEPIYGSGPCRVLVASGVTRGGVRLVPCGGTISPRERIPYGVGVSRGAVGFGKSQIWLRAKQFQTGNILPD